jgi:hypothetical protein
MNRINIIVWLSAGILIGWVVKWYVELEHQQTLKIMAMTDQGSEED